MATCPQAEKQEQGAEDSGTDANISVGLTIWLCLHIVISAAGVFCIFFWLCKWL